jgi:DNA polymerase elongation subunit (family B)
MSEYGAHIFSHMDPITNKSLKLLREERKKEKERKRKKGQNADLC